MNHIDVFFQHSFGQESKPTVITSKPSISGVFSVYKKFKIDELNDQ
jgi:hypothetical protein